MDRRLTIVLCKQRPGHRDDKRIECLSIARKIEGQLAQYIACFRVCIALFKHNGSNACQLY